MRWLNTVVAGAIVLAGIVLLPVWRPIDPGLDAPRGVVADAPSSITAELRALVQPGDRLLNSQRWGSWFEFAVPDLPVAIDSRIEFFPVEVWDAYDQITTGRDGWEAQLERWGATIAAIEGESSAFADRLSGIGWRSVYADADGSILVSPDR